MEIHSCLLHDQNELIIEGLTLAERLRISGKTQLWSQRSTPVIDTVILHYISAINILPADPFNFEAIIKIFCDYGVSAHYLIKRDGSVYRLVPEEKKAWHCGGSIMPEPDNRTGVNDFSIGIELMATSDSGFTSQQYDSLVDLCTDIGKRLNRKLFFWGHEDVAGHRAVKLGLRNEAKCDPGKLFDWETFRRRLEEYAKK